MDAPADDRALRHPRPHRGCDIGDADLADERGQWDYRPRCGRSAYPRGPCTPGRDRRRAAADLWHLVTSDIRNLPAPAERSPSAERHPAPAFLASVTNVAEARLAVSSGADIIDCKDPSRGALGALPLDAIFAVRAAVPREIPVSATVGDLKPEPDVLALAVE